MNRTHSKSGMLPAMAAGLLAGVVGSLTVSFFATKSEAETRAVKARVSAASGGEGTGKNPVDDLAAAAAPFLAARAAEIAARAPEAPREEAPPDREELAQKEKAQHDALVKAHGQETFDAHWANETTAVLSKNLEGLKSKGPFTFGDIDCRS